MKEQPEAHESGHVSIENYELHKEAMERGDFLNADFGLQISVDGRVWVCVNGISFIRFKPKRKMEMK